MQAPAAPYPSILYSCIDTRQRSSEQFVAEHALGIILTGESHFQSPTGLQVYGPGTIGLVRRNQLLKSLKVPPANGPFKAINIVFDREVLRRYSAEHQLTASDTYAGPGMVDLSLDPFLQGYFNSLLPYFDQPAQLSPALMELKTREAIELVLRTNPQLSTFLFDFSEPHKIDLPAFMEQYFHYNVSLEQFARLTGRSLATFKRDFQKLFAMAPQKWLHQKRLEQAHHLLATEHQRPAAVYLEVGFGNMSHFSAAFKQHFGYNASSLVGS